MNRRRAALVALALAACGRTGLDTDAPVLLTSDPRALGGGGEAASGGALAAVGGGADVGLGGAPSAGAAGHGGSSIASGSGGNPVLPCNPDQAPCSVAAECCSKMCHNEDIPVCGPPPCSPPGVACLVPTDCCSKTCADGICAKPVCTLGAGACTGCATSACCTELSDCQTNAACAQDVGCEAACVDQGKPFLSCWETCVAPSLIANALFSCIAKQCAAACP